MSGSYGYQNANAVADIYKTVMQDVINQVKEAFLDENIDIDILSQLKKDWEDKVNSSGCVDMEPRPQQMQQHHVAPAPMRQPQMQGPPRMNVPIARMPPQPQQVQQLQLVGGGHPGHQIGLQMDPTGGQRQPQLQMPYLQQTSMGQIPIQANHLGVGVGGVPQLGNSGGIAFPPGQAVRMMPGIPGGQHFMPNQPGMMFIQNNGQQNLVAMPPNAILQGRVQPGLHQPGMNQLDGTSRTTFEDSDDDEADVVGSSSQTASSSKRASKKPMKGKMEKKTREEAMEMLKHLLIQCQLDGGGGGMSDSSSEEEEEDNDPLRRIADKIGGDGAIDEGEAITEEDPLNSGDDQSDDEDLETIFDADNIIMCLFEKVHRARSKWKFILKDGIMHINNRDFCFQKCTGDAEW